MKKFLLPTTLLATLLLAGCSSLTPAEQKENDAFNNWSSTVFEKQSFSYDKNVELKGVAQEELKPILDTLFESVPKDRFGLKVDVFKDDRWIDNICKDFVDENGDIIKEPLPNPVVGDRTLAIINGYLSGKQLDAIAKKLKVELVQTEGENLLVGSDVNPSYKAAKYSFSISTENFKVIVEGDSGWNVLLWEQYQTVEDPGRWSDKEKPLPNDSYMPVTVRIYYTTACAEPKPLFNLKGDSTPAPTETSK